MGKIQVSKREEIIGTIIVCVVIAGILGLFSSCLISEHKEYKKKEVARREQAAKRARIEREAQKEYEAFQKEWKSSEAYKKVRQQELADELKKQENREWIEDNWGIRQEDQP